LLENNTLGIIDGDKRLTPTEVNEIIAYNQLTNPAYAEESFKQFSKIAEKVEKDQKEELLRLGKIKPDGSEFNLFTKNPYGGLPILNLDNKYFKSFASDFLIKTNESQMEVSVGQIARSNEFREMSNKASEYVEIMSEYGKNLNQIQTLQQQLQQAEQQLNQTDRNSRDFFFAQQNVNRLQR